MRKTVTLIFGLVLFCLSSMAINRDHYISGVEISVEKAGTLDSIVNDRFGDDWMYVSTIKVSGKLNGADIAVLRRLGGGNERGLYSMGNTKVIDMSDAEIVGSSDVFLSPYFSGDLTAKDNEIPDYMFYNCSALVNVILPKNITVMGKHVFDTCINLKLATLPKNITAVPEGTFNECSSLVNLVLGKSVSKIEDKALSGCSSLRYITCLGLTPATVGDQSSDDDYGGYDDYSKPALALSSSSPIKVFVPSSALSDYQAAEWWKGYDVIASPSGIVDWPMPTDATLQFASGESLSDYFFRYYPVVAGSVTSLSVKGYLSAGDFYGIDEIVHFSPVTRLDLSDVLLTPSSYSGRYMTYRIYSDNALSNKLFGDYYYDYNNTGTLDLVETIVLPEATTEIGANALRWHRLKNVIIGSANKYFTVQDNVVYTKNKKELVTCPVGYVGEIDLPSELEVIRDSALFKCDSVTKAVFPSGVRYLGVRSFQDCRNLTDVVLNEGLPAVGKDAFSMCWNLKDVDIPSSVKTIGEGAFNDCRSFTKIDVPSNVTFLDDDAFASCGNIKTVTLREGLKRIGGGCFNNIHTISKFIIPASVDSIGRNFCPDSLVVRDIYSLSKVPPFAYDNATGYPTGSTFYGMSHDKCILHVPAGTASAYRAAAGWNWFTNIVDDAQDVMTGVSSVKDNKSAVKERVFYDLSGTIVKTPSPGQIVISKGKKFLWK